MDFWTKAERLFRRACLGDDWRIHAVNPAGLLDFRAKGLPIKEIQKRVDADFDSGSFPVRLKVQTSSGKAAFEMYRSGMLQGNTICTGQISIKGQRYLTFEAA